MAWHCFIESLGGTLVGFVYQYRHHQSWSEKGFKWTEVAKKEFQTLKQEVATKPILILPTFDKLFTIECDASNVAVGVY